MTKSELKREMLWAYEIIQKAPRHINEYNINGLNRDAIVENIDRLCHRKSRWTESDRWLAEEVERDAKRLVSVCFEDLVKARV